MYFSFAKYVGQCVSLPAGELFVSNNIISFRPRGEQTIYGYKTNGKGNITGRFLNEQWVSWKIWKIEIARHEGLRNSNFGRKPLHGMKGLGSRNVSRFLWEGKPSTPQKAEDPSTPPAEKTQKKKTRGKRTRGKRKAKWFHPTFSISNKAISEV
ncbi:MAG: hypothetical protein LBD34_02395 [Puniceicoccales bacterium]|jgi:hypothetical protein|nr:hypothetical protein [Puniceicoccales bacterium]